ncbi:MAG: hypothetical protein J6575_03710 [Bifidobacterium sp.]|nr:hypothetical protein [Bifidobacterium sp.]
MDNGVHYAALEIHELSRSLLKKLTALLGQGVTVNDLSKGALARLPVKIYADNGRTIVEWTMRKEVDPDRLANFLREATR